MNLDELTEKLHELPYPADGVSATDIATRLDTVLGPDHWRLIVHRRHVGTRASGMVSILLEVTLAIGAWDGLDWQVVAERWGLGGGTAGSVKGAEDAAQAEALRFAAALFSVGRLIP